MTEHRERLSPAIPPCPETWWEESAHLWRYYYAAERLRGEAVSEIIDAGCGTGYGSNILLYGVNRHVIGYDYSPDVLDEARETYPGVEFIHSDLDYTGLVDLPVVEQPEDENMALVCFETLEHMEDPWLFLKRLPDRVRHLIVSAPIVPNSSPYNPYHRHDFTLESFRSLVTGAGFVIQDERLQSSPWRINLYAVVHGVRPE